MTARFYELSSEYAPWCLAIEFDYSAEMVEAIKQHIPGRQRAWKPSLRQWWFQDSAHTAIVALALLHCGDVQYIRENKDVASTLPAETVAAFATLHLLPSAPDDLVKAAYRVMSKRCHPDKGGEVKAMQRVNDAYARLTHK